MIFIAGCIKNMISHSLLSGSPFRMAIRSFGSRHYKSNKSYCTVERRNGVIADFRMIFWSAITASNRARVLRAIRNEWVKKRGTAREIYSWTRGNHVRHMCIADEWGREGGRGSGEGSTLFPGWRRDCFRAYDAIKQNTRAHAFRAAPLLRFNAASSLRVNDVTIMSPSRIITIAADTDLYNIETKTEMPRGNAAIPSRRLPKLRVVLAARHFPNSKIKKTEKKRKTKKAHTQRQAFFYQKKY